MAWEERNGNYYYYLKERTGSCVRSVYVGKDETARLIDEFSSLRQCEEKQRREYERELRIFDERADRALDSHSELTEMLTVAALLASGHHTHKRQWRRKR
jgi:hypothetical protein